LPDLAELLAENDHQLTPSSSANKVTYDVDGYRDARIIRIVTIGPQSHVIKCAPGNVINGFLTSVTLSPSCPTYEFIGTGMDWVAY
jgi:hypothetical protein